MPIPRRLFGSALSLLASGLAVGCFLSGDYRVQRDGIGLPGETGKSPPPELPASASASVETVGPAQSEEPAASSATPTETSEPSPGVSASEATSTDVPAASVEPSETLSPPASTSAPEPNSSTPTPGPTSTAGSVPSVTVAPSASCPGQSAPSGNGCINPCATGETVGPNGNCYWVSTVKRTWDQATAACKTHGGSDWTLATIHNQEDHDFVTGLLSDDTWIGAEDGTRQEGIWFWADEQSPFWRGDDTGAPINGAFEIWGNGEPSGSNGEDCARYRWTGTEWKWSDSECSDTYSAVCESH